MSRFDDMVNGLREEIDVPEKVWRGYVKTLERLPEKNRGRNRYGDREKDSAVWKVAAAVLVSVTLLGTGVYAAGKYFGILDFLKTNENAVQIPIEAKDLIVPVQEQKKEDITEGMFADYTVKEAMCDSESIYVVLEARAKEAGRYFFVPEDAMPEDSVSGWGIESGMSAAEYAASKNLKMLHINAGIVNTDELGIAVSTIYFQSVGDDVMDIMIECGKTAKEKTLDVVCTGIAWEDGRADMDEIMRSEIRFALTDISNAEAVEYVPSGTSEISGIGAVIEKAEVIQTKLGTYLEILYQNENTDFDGFSIRPAGEYAGTEHKIRMPSGTEMLENGEKLWRLSLEKTEFGGHIVLEAYDTETKKVYGTFELVKK